MITHQGRMSCPECGSWYRNGTKCSYEKCGIEIKDPEYIRPEKRIRQKGKLWSSKLHRYLTPKEITAGFKGG